MATLSQIRNAIRTKVDAITDFREVSFPVEFFDRSQNSLAHLGFAVGCRISNASNERQRGTRHYLETDIQIVFAHRIRPHSVTEDYNNALDTEKTVIDAVLGSYSDIQPGTELRYNRSTRVIANSIEYTIITIELTAYHTP